MLSSAVCQHEKRRHEVRERFPDFNGIDYLEVSDDQKTLTVFFIGCAPQNPALEKENVRIEGGRRVTNIKVTAVSPCSDEDCRPHRHQSDDCVKLTLDKIGDFSTYTLRLIDARNPKNPFPGFDPRYDSIEFSFKANCPGAGDCLAPPVCLPPKLEEPEINYLAKDYASFRGLILDRLSLLIPEWRERHVPDLGIALVEILAYVGDYLSYYQDAVATEAYLETARKRISVRRHVRLLDYPMHEGCNARAWIVLETDEPHLELAPEKISFLTGISAAQGSTSAMVDAEELRSVGGENYEVFEPMGAAPIHIYREHNEIHFYTWGDEECCLPQGATRATLLDQDDEEIPEQQPEPEPDKAQQQMGRKGPCAEPPAAPEKERKLQHLKIGDVLIFEEVLGPHTGLPADADFGHRHAVRLTQVEPGRDELYNRRIVEIAWAPEDQLPFALCLSSTSQNCDYLPHVSVARGNVVLADHGRSRGRLWADERFEKFDPVPRKTTRPTCDGECAPAAEIVPERFNPRLKNGPLTFHEPLPNQQKLEETPASALMRQNPRRALPHLTIEAAPAASDGAETTEWRARFDLWNSEAQDADYVVEMDEEGRAHLRFGDGELGKMPAAGTVFEAKYRIGNGVAGNVGAGAISHLVLQGESAVTAVRNPLPAMGGTAPEPLAQVKLFAPHAFRSELQRAVTADDYARLAERENPGVGRAAATLVWTGSWRQVVIAIDPVNQAVADEKLLREVEKSLRPYRRIGHEIVAVEARMVPLDIEFTVCVGRGFTRRAVEADLRAVLGRGDLADGGRGFFHPDNLSFGQGIAASHLVALAGAVPGVENVVITKLQRRGQASAGELERNFLAIGPNEIARLDDDPNFPENGRLTLDLRGAR